MADFVYKEYSEEEDRIYNEAIAKIREAIKNGLNFNEACSIINVDNELKKFIVDDALKIMIAEMHYANGMSLKQVADALKIPIRAVDIANMEMLEDVGITAAEIYRKSNPGSPMGNA
ncbi:hypothetical protein JZK55_07210 [Dissulfurispira thermophila]|uniref:Uncharacterized protein n=2 Tax=root TaxID=1 RepID=A0A7G1H0J3_9BACT|nr:hypothetical protein [Dissulfurispira thermophila]BCB95799.1 hypothetical protein JZK55_07210 [Dissulfurispira thermophila]